MLRSIEREQEIKEALFLLLLQKREEAAINFAVTKPSIKIIDKAITNILPVLPKVKLSFLLAIILAFIIPTIILYIIFLLDTKIHTREQLTVNLNDIPIIAELPHISDTLLLNKLGNSNSRHPLVESIRMLIANLNFVLFNNNEKNNVILVTSSIKGEGKTIISSNMANILSNKFDKILLVGADLRNPQIHKLIDKDKSVRGLSDYIYSNDYEWRNLIIKNDKLDILLSGTIPPDPTELLSSNKFKNFINEVKNNYDYVVIDSAPCLLVSDTFEISKFADTTLYMLEQITHKLICATL